MDISHAFVKRSHEIKEKSFKRFNEWSKKYDRSILQSLVFRNSHDMFIKHIVHDRTSLKVLDIGCGTGEFALKLKAYKKDASIFGIDISSDMIKVAKEKTKSKGDIDLRIGDVEKMPYDSDYFDCITCAHSFHHYHHAADKYNCLPVYTTGRFFTVCSREPEP